MNSMKTDSGDWEAGRTRDTVRMGYWSAAWVATTALAAFGPKILWDFQTALTIAAVLVNLAVGFGMVAATRRYLKGQDELQRKIFLDAGALTLGVGLVCGLSYELLEDVRLIAYEPAISHLVILMSLTFIVGMIVGHRRYR